METTIYDMIISNTATFIRSEENRKAIINGGGLNAFTASYVLSIALCKDKTEIIADLMNVEIK